MNLGKEFEVRTFTFEVRLNAFLHYGMATSLWGPEIGMWGI